MGSENQRKASRITLRDVFCLQVESYIHITQGTHEGNLAGRGCYTGIALEQLLSDKVLGVRRRLHRLPPKPAERLPGHHGRSTVLKEAALPGHHEEKSETTERGSIRSKLRTSAPFASMQPTALGLGLVFAPGLRVTPACDRL